MRKPTIFSIPAAAFALWAGLWTPTDRAGTEYDSSHWIGEGLDCERAGDFAAAEADLLRAARIDRLYHPRWTLAGFYFRRNDFLKFRNWAREALAVGTRDLGALFDLCLRIGVDPAAISGRKPVWREYLQFLMETDRWPAASSVAARIAAAVDPGDQALLTNYCDLAPGHGERRAGFAVWNAMRGESGLLSNGDFDAKPTGHGFDWRMPAVNGATAAFHNGEASVTVTGYQPDRAVLLEQPLALEPNRRYVLRYEWKADQPMGIHWEAAATKGADLVPSGWAAGRFELPGNAETLSLIYERAPGTRNAEGTLSLRRLDISPK